MSYLSVLKRFTIKKTASTADRKLLDRKYKSLPKRANLSKTREQEKLTLSCQIKFKFGENVLAEPIAMNYITDEELSSLPGVVEAAAHATRTQ